MEKITWKAMLLSLSGILIADVGGASMASKLAGDGAFVSYFIFSLIVTSLITPFQIVIYNKAKNELVFDLIFRGVACLIVVWFILSILIPIFWMNSIGIVPKWLIAFLLVAISLANIQRGFNLMQDQWTQFGEAEFYRLFDRSSSSVNWYDVMKVVKIKFEIFVPGLPIRYATPVGVFLLGSMLVGLNLRNVFPVFCVFAWGIPAIVVASLVLQISSHMFSQAYKVKQLQMDTGLKIKSVN